MKNKIEKRIKTFPKEVKDFISNGNLANLNTLDIRSKQGIAEIFMYRVSDLCCNKCKKNISNFIKKREWKDSDIFWPNQ